MKFAFPNINNPNLALDRATQTLLVSLRNPILFYQLLLTNEMIIISFSSP